MTQPPPRPFIGISIEALLRPCEIYPVAVDTGNGFIWEWSALAGDGRSAHPFEMFFDCLEDARANGYEPHFLHPQPDLTLIPVPPRGI